MYGDILNWIFNYDRQKSDDNDHGMSTRSGAVAAL